MNQEQELEEQGIENDSEQVLDAPVTPPVVLSRPEPAMELEMEPESSSRSFNWIGSPTKEDAEDGISDLFEVSDEDIHGGIDDLTSVDIEKDILDAGEDGTLDDLTDVTEADIMGDEDYDQPPNKAGRQASRQSRRSSGLPKRYPVDPGMRGIQY